MQKHAFQVRPGQPVYVELPPEEGGRTVLGEVTGIDLPTHRVCVVWKESGQGERKVWMEDWRVVPRRD